MGLREILVGSWCLVTAIFFFRRRYADALNEAINNFVNNFRGGPPGPMHPSPADDGSLLRRSWKIEK